MPLLEEYIAFCEFLPYSSARWLLPFQLSLFNYLMFRWDLALSFRRFPLLYVWHSVEVWWYKVTTGAKSRYTDARSVTKIRWEHLATFAVTHVDILCTKFLFRCTLIELLKWNDILKFRWRNEWLRILRQRYVIKLF